MKVRYLVHAHHFYHPCLQMEDLLVSDSHSALVNKPFSDSLQTSKTIRELSAEPGVWSEERTLRMTVGGIQWLRSS